MKNIMALPIAALAALMAASSPAYTPVYRGEDQSDDFSPTRVTAMTDMHLGRIGYKDLDGSYLVHAASAVHHGTPGVTLRFHNAAAQERSFLVISRINLSPETWKEFSVPPGGTTEFTLFMPLALERGGGYNRGVTLLETTPGNTKLTAEVMNLADLDGFESFGNAPPSVLLSADINAKKLAADMTSALAASKYTQRYKDDSYRSRTKTGEKAKYELTGRRFTFPASDWPHDWRCYTTYDSVFITAAEYGELTAQAKYALDVYRLLGGAVIVTSGDDGFASSSEALKALKAVDDSCEALTGDLNIARYHYSSYSKTNIMDDLKRIPIEAKSTIPVKTLLLVLAVFSLVIVPLVIFRSVQRNMRMRLIFLLPGSAAVFAVLIAVFAYAFFGTTPTVRLQSVTILDQTTKKAFTRGQLSLFSPVSIEGRMSFPLDATFRMRNVGGEQTPSIKVADAQTLHGSWVKPLVTSFFDFERACDRPERLDFRVSQSGEVTAVNLLGAKIVWGQVNVGGKLWSFRDVPPGGESKATKVNQAPSAPKPPRYPFDKSTSFGRDWEATLAAAMGKLNEIPAGEYIVEVEGSPFFPNPVSKKTNATAVGLVYGKFKEVAE